MASPIQIALKGQKMALRKTVAATLNALTSSTVDEQCVCVASVSFPKLKRKKKVLTQQPSFYFLRTSPRNNGKSSFHTCYSRM